MVKEVAAGPLQSDCRRAGLGASRRWSRRHRGSTAPRGRQGARAPAAPPRERVRRGRSRRQASAIYPGAAGGRRGVLGGGSGRSGACGERTDGRTHARAGRRGDGGGSPGGGVGLSQLQRHKESMAESSDKLYRVEYAKSGRASCKKCSESIPKDSLRMAIMVQVRAAGPLCARRGFRVRQGWGEGLPRAAGRAGRSGSARGLWPLLLPVRPAACTFRKVLLILQEKPGKYGLKLVVSSSL